MLEPRGKAMVTDGPTESPPRQADVKPVPGRRARPRRKVPRLVLAEGLLPVIYDYVHRFRMVHGDGLETGGMLIGQYANLPDGPQFTINGMIEAGPQAEYSPDSILFDGDYQAGVLQAIRRQHPRVGNMGCVHLHPGRMDHCSAGDKSTDIDAVLQSDTRSLVFGILTLDNPHRTRFGVRYRNLKLDCFILGEPTRFEYVQVRPNLQELPVVQAPAVPVLNEGVRLGWHYSPPAKLLLDKKRLVAEVRAMRERYGDLAVLRQSKARLYWEYTVRESGRQFPVEIVYPKRYPLEPPRIVSVLPLPTSPHQLVDNELCWTDRASQAEWNPARDTAAICVHAAHRWFACLLVYLTLGEWPEGANDWPVRQV